MASETRRRQAKSATTVRRAAALLEAIEKHHADMIAVGFRGTSLFERFVLGSVSRADRAFGDRSGAGGEERIVERRSRRAAGRRGPTAVSMLAAYDGRRNSASESPALQIKSHGLRARSAP